MLRSQIGKGPETLSAARRYATIHLPIAPIPSCAVACDDAQFSARKRPFVQWFVLYWV